MSDITLMLPAVSRGERHASSDLLPSVYDELRHLAAARMAREAAGQACNPPPAWRSYSLALMAHWQGNYPPAIDLCGRSNYPPIMPMPQLVTALVTPVSLVLKARGDPERGSN